MRLSLHAVVSSITILSSIFLGASNGFAREISLEELNALEARRALTSCLIEIESTYWKTSSTGDRERYDDHRIIYFDGENIRNDEIEAYDPEKHPSKQGTYRTISCLVGKEHIYWSDRVFPNGHKHAFTIRPYDFEEVRLMMPVDPRMVGMTTTTILNTIQSDLESVVGYPDRRRTAVSDVSHHGDSCRLVEYGGREDFSRKIWICPGKGFAVVKIESSARSGGSQYHEISESDVKNVKGADAWYPTKYRYKRWIDGNLVSEQDATIKVISMNKPLSKDTFTLAGIGVPPGTRIHRVPAPSDGLEEYWDGRQIAIVTPGEEMKIAVGWTWTRILLATVSVLAAAGAAWFILQRTKQYAS